MCSFAETTHTPQGGRRGGKLIQIVVVLPQWRNNPHPARGRKRCRYSSLWNLLGKQPTPARGRKLVHQPDGFVKNDWKQPTPRKGTETSASRPGSPSGLPRNNPHPARGRKPSRIYPTILLATWKQPTPRKGRKLFVVAVRPVPDADETTHTPQGDGNALSTIQSPQSYRNNPHPARGRKLC